MTDENDFVSGTFKAAPEETIEVLEALSNYEHPNDEYTEKDIDIIEAQENIQELKLKLASEFSEPNEPVALPEPDHDGPIALMERGWDLMVSAHGGNITTALRSWRELARQWREDCLDWEKANPTADN